MEGLFPGCASLSDCTVIFCQNYSFLQGKQKSLSSYQESGLKAREGGKKKERKKKLLHCRVCTVEEKEESDNYRKWGENDWQQEEGAKHLQLYRLNLKVATVRVFNPL